MHSTLSYALLLAVALCAGCTSYHKTPVQEFEAHPAKFVNKKVRVHYAGTVDSTIVNGRTARERSGTIVWGAPDSVVSLHVSAVDYPMLTGRTIPKAKVYGQAGPVIPVQVSLQGSRQVDVHGLDVGRTILLCLGVFLVAPFLFGVGSGGP